MSQRKIEAKSEAKVLGNTEVKWDIVGWCGPLFHFMRTRATCFVNVPVTTSASDSSIRLCFHLRSYQCHELLTHKFCIQRNQYVERSTECYCCTCILVPTVVAGAHLPLEFQPNNSQITTWSSGYSLLMDVLHCPLQTVTLGISVKKLNGISYTPKINYVLLEPGSPRKDIMAVANFWRMIFWTVDASGKIENCRATQVDSVQDARFLLTKSNGNHGNGCANSSATE